MEETDSQAPTQVLIAYFFFFIHISSIYKISLLSITFFLSRQNLFADETLPDSLPDGPAYWEQTSPPESYSQDELMTDWLRSQEVQELPTTPTTSSSSSTTTPPLNVAQEIPIPQPKFRMNAKTVFCTWPHNNKPLQDIYTKCSQMHNVAWFIVAEEQHEDGQPHRHALLHFKTKGNWRNYKVFDDLAGTHGNYKAARNVAYSIKYIIKDGHYLTHGIDVTQHLQATTKHKSTQSSIIAEAILEGKPMSTLIQHNPGFVLLHQKPILDFYALKEKMDADKAKKLWKPITFNANQAAEERIIGAWLNRNLPLSPKRDLGETQLYIWGATNLGKTHLCNQLSNYFPTYHCTTMENFFNGLNETYKLIIFDEFHGQHPITFMNQILDGQKMQIPQKGTMYYKQNNPAIIILSNMPPEKCYPNISNNHPEVFAALLRRLCVVNITQQMHFDL